MRNCNSINLGGMFSLLFEINENCTQMLATVPSFKSRRTKEINHYLNLKCPLQQGGEHHLNNATPLSVKMIENWCHWRPQNIACDGDVIKKTVKKSNLKQSLMQNTDSMKYLLWLSKCIDKELLFINYLHSICNEVLSNLKHHHSVLWIFKLASNCLWSFAYVFIWKHIVTKNKTGNAGFGVIYLISIHICCLCAYK